MKLRGLYAITDSQLLDDGRLLPYVEAALRGGACNTATNPATRRGACARRKACANSANATARS